jgi:hypothetical protein
VRIPPEQHRNLAIQAAEQGVSLKFLNSLDNEKAKRFGLTIALTSNDQFLTGLTYQSLYLPDQNLAATNEMDGRFIRNTVSQYADALRNKLKITPTFIAP